MKNKKTVSAILVLALALGLGGCANRTEVTTPAAPEPTAAPVQATADPVDDGIPVTTPEPTAEPAPVPAADLLDGR